MEIHPSKAVSCPVVSIITALTYLPTMRLIALLSYLCLVMDLRKSSREVTRDSSKKRRLASFYSNSLS